MFTRLLLRYAFCVSVTACSITAGHSASASTNSQAAASQPTPFDAFDAALMSGDIAAARRIGHEHLAAKQTMDQGRFEVALATAVDALGGFQRDLYRYGFRISDSARILMYVGVTFPGKLPTDPTPQEIRYEDTQRMLVQLVDRLAECDRWLSEIPGDASVKVRLHAAMIGYDLDGDGTVAPDVEGLMPVLRATILGGRSALSPEELAAFAIALDRADVAWLRAYCNLLMGAANCALAYDYRELFDHTATLLFPKVRSPFFDAADKRYEKDRAGTAGFLDVVAFIHLLRFPLASPDRLIRAHACFKTTIAASEEMWRLARAEWDDDMEWIPNARQRSPLPMMQVTDARIDAWLLSLSEAERVLDGKQLVGINHITEKRGVNIRRVFLEPRSMDLVMWIHGGGALAYMEEGEITDWGRAGELRRLLGADFWAFSFWVN